MTNQKKILIVILIIFLLILAGIFIAYRQFSQQGGIGFQNGRSADRDLILFSGGQFGVNGEITEQEQGETGVPPRLRQISQAPTAGGNNEPPRGKLIFNERGEPIYGEKDIIDLEKMRELGRPFWLAGSYAHRDRIAEALAGGAAGIQAGTIFALCEESGLRADIKRELRRQAYCHQLDVVADPKTSSSGFPFNVVQLSGTISDAEVYEARTRICDVGYLRHAYKTDRGKVAFRCPSEPVNVYVKRGGKIEDTVGRKCLCNGLMAAVVIGQFRDAEEELPIVTLGRTTDFIHKLIDSQDGCYTAENAISYLLGNQS